ncbi:MAG: DUF362 domain-containing protein [bacterium]|nr:DUF362 domain-containing protein [bacterium]MDT8365956.1 DUF362 domain-containing protein [bacterium]
MNRGKGCLTRRQFIKGSLILLAAPGSVIPTSVGRAAVNFPGPVSTISLSEGGDPYATTVSCIEGLGGMSAFVSRGDSVLLKPNIGWDRRVEQGANTHPEVVRAIGEMCLEAGAAKVVILDRPCNDARRTYRTSGIQDMVKGLSDGRISLEFVRDNRFLTTDIPWGIVIKKWPLYEEALKADIIINIPVAKHHSISRLTLGMKNLMGLMGGNRGSFHSGIGQKLADLTSALDPGLTVLDATRIMVRNGPTGGRLEDVKVLNRVAAGRDPVAIDAYGATLFGITPGDLSFVTAAYKMGLGEMDLKKVQLIET